MRHVGHEGASISSRCASCAMHKHFYTWKRFLYGWGICSLRMETSLRGRSGGHTGAAPTISRMACTIRLSANSSLHHKNKCIVVANSSPHHKHECIVVASCSPHHKHECIVVANSLPHHKHECIVVANSLPHYKHEHIVVANSLPHHKHECIVVANSSPRHKHE